MTGYVWAMMPRYPSGVRYSGDHHMDFGTHVTIMSYGTRVTIIGYGTQITDKYELCYSCDYFRLWYSGDCDAHLLDK